MNFVVNFIEFVTLRLMFYAFFLYNKIHSEIKTWNAKFGPPLGDMATTGFINNNYLCPLRSVGEEYLFEFSPIHFHTRFSSWFTKKLSTWTKLSAGLYQLRRNHHFCIEILMKSLIGDLQIGYRYIPDSIRWDSYSSERILK